MLSIEVGVVFCAERVSSGAMYPEFSASHIPSRRSAMMENAYLDQRGLQLSGGNCM